jgi:hypothetical protein
MVQRNAGIAIVSVINEQMDHRTSLISLTCNVACSPIDNIAPNKVTNKQVHPPLTPDERIHFILKVSATNASACSK